MKMKFKAISIFSLSIIFLFASFSIAPAQQAGPFYVGVFGAFVAPDDLDVEGIDVALKDGWAMGAKVGYIIPQFKWFAAELEYAYLSKQDSDEPGLDGSIKSHNVMANFLFRYPEGKFHPFLGFGVGFSRGTIESSTLSIDKDDTAFAAQFIVGLNFQITPNLSADLAYKYFACQYEIEHVDVDASNNIFQLGINYHF